MYTFVTKNYELQVQRRHGMGPGAVALDSDEVDKILADRIEKFSDLLKEDRKRWREAEREYDRERQVRVFATFCRPVPDDAMEHPLQMVRHGNFNTLFADEYGYTMRVSERSRGCHLQFLYTGSAYASKYPDWSVPCEDDEKVAPWLRDLVAEFGGKMVFRACLSVRPNQSRLDDVCSKHGLPLSNATFARAILTEPADLWAFHVYVDGATVAIHSDRVEVIQHAEALTPWSKMMLARPDAHAILVDIAHVLAQP